MGLRNEGAWYLLLNAVVSFKPDVVFETLSSQFYYADEFYKRITGQRACRLITERLMYGSVRNGDSNCMYITSLLCPIRSN